MMLRSSSTPILGSLISSHSDSPNHHHHSEINPSKQCYSPISFHHHQNHNKKLGSVHLINPCQSPISPSIADFPAQEFGSNGFRRAQSEGNLEGLLASSTSFDGFDESDSSVPPKKFSRKHNCTVLEPIPSFSLHNSLEDEEADEEREEDGLEEQGGESAETTSNSVNFINLSLEKSYAYNNQVANLPCQEENQRVLSKMHIARGLGHGDVAGSTGSNYGGGGGNEGKRRGSNGDDGGGANKVEEYYERMMEENPGDPLFMRNYAEFLYQTKNDLKGAEEHYSRAILADPTDGEILSKYAEVIWALHHDQDRAASYFERAVQAAPEDSLVLAAHASFLWETEEDDETEGGALEKSLDKVAPQREDTMATAKA